MITVKQVVKHGKLIAAVSIFAVGAYYLKISNVPEILSLISSNKAFPELKFYHPQKDSPSFDPVDSDLLSNQIFMKHLVGTLVRYRSGGEFAPYLAESWRAADGGKSWSFFIRNGLSCEDGEEISAQSFKKSYQRIFPIYKKQSNLPYFDDLKDMIVDGQVLTFKFNKPVNSGFLEYMSMAYYGFFCEENFKKGNWKSKKKITSSGSYALTEVNEIEKYGVLKSRTNWPVSIDYANGPKTVKIFWGDVPSGLQSSRAIVQTNDAPGPLNPAFVKVLGAPDILYSVVLDINSKSPFRSKKLRQKFKSILRLRQKELIFNSETATLTDKIFIDQNVDLSNQSTLSEPKIENIDFPIDILTTDSVGPELKYAEELVAKTLSEIKIPFNFKRIGSDPNYKPKDKASRDKFSVRIVSVFSGATFDSWVTDMMFCSSLGISFPDPSGHICTLIKKSLAGEDARARKSIANDMANIIEEDSSVLPVFHIRNAFYFSDDIDLKSIAPDTIVLDFESLELK
jgi:hypothetical protein